MTNQSQQGTKAMTNQSQQASQQGADTMTNQNSITEAERIHKNFFVLHRLWFAKTDKEMQKLYMVHTKDKNALKQYSFLFDVDRQIRENMKRTKPVFSIEMHPHEGFYPEAERLAYLATALLIFNENTTDEAFELCAKDLGIVWEPWMWQQHTNDRGIPNGLKHLSEHSDMSLSGYFRSPSNEVSDAAKAEWRKRYPVMEWGVSPSNFGRPSGIKGWAWSAHCNAWKGKQA